MTRNLIIIAGLVCLAIGGWVLTRPDSTPIDPTVSGIVDNVENIDTSSVTDMSLGNFQEAAVTVIEYASFTCPHCATFHADTFKQLKSAYIDTGKINFIYRDVYFDRYGLWASIVARCGEGAENRFFGIAEMIYQKQREWASSGNSPQAIVDQLRTIGKTAGLTDADLDACFADAENAERLYAFYLKNADADQINSTPSLVINGQKHSNLSFDELKAIIDEKLSG